MNTLFDVIQLYAKVNIDLNINKRRAGVYEAEIRLLDSNQTKYFTWYDTLNEYAVADKLLNILDDLFKQRERQNRQLER